MIGRCMLCRVLMSVGQAQKARAVMKMNELIGDGAFSLHVEV